MIQRDVETDYHEVRTAGSSVVRQIPGKTKITVTTDETYALETDVHHVICLEDDVDILMDGVLHLEDYFVLIERPSTESRYQVKDGEWQLIGYFDKTKPPVRPGFYGTIQTAPQVTINLPRAHGKSQMMVRDLTNGKSITVANSQEQAEKLYKEYKDIIVSNNASLYVHDGDKWNKIST